MDLPTEVAMKITDVSWRLLHPAPCPFEEGDLVRTEDGVVFRVTDEKPEKFDIVITRNYGIWRYWESLCGAPWPYWAGECKKLVEVV
jgi:hypothetical protein